MVGCATLLEKGKGRSESVDLELNAPGFGQTAYYFCHENLSMGTRVAECAGELVRELASAVYPGRGGPRYLLMLAIHLDDSGILGGPHFFLGGYLAATEKWALLSDRWNELCQEHLAGEPLILESSHLNEHQREVSDVALMAFAECAVAFSEIELWAAFPDSEQRKFDNKGYGARFDKYRTSLLCLAYAVVNDYQLQERAEPVTWFFKRPGDIPLDARSSAQEESASLSLTGAYLDMLGYQTMVKQSAYKPLLHHFGLVSYRDTPPLQAAHLLAVMKRRYHADPGDSRTVHPAYEVLRSAAMRRIQVVLFDHRLEELFNQIEKRSQTR